MEHNESSFRAVRESVGPGIREEDSFVHADRVADTDNRINGIKVEEAFFMKS